MKQLITNLYQWCLHPDDVELDLRRSAKFVIVCRLVLLHIVFAIPFIVVLGVIDWYVVPLEYVEKSLSPGLLLIAATIVAPLFEEFVFRFPLKYQRNYLAQLINWLTRGALRRRWVSLYRYFVYLMALLFGFVHLSNYVNDEFSFYLFSPLVIGSQIVGGMMLSYARVKLGFVWSVLMHGLYNLVLISIYLV